MPDSLQSSGAGSGRGKLLLALGAAAGPFYILVGLAQILTREGFDVRRHALSLMANGELGWVQVANFLLSGLLVMSGALGCRRALRSQKAGTWGPILLAVYGVGLVGAGVFRADPGGGFPPGAADATRLSSDGMLHFVFGAMGFFAIIAACFVFARRYFRQRRRALGWFSIVTGLGFLGSFMAVGSGSTQPGVIVGFYLGVAWIWAWHTIVLVGVARGPDLAPVV